MDRLMRKSLAAFVALALALAGLPPLAVAQPTQITGCNRSIPYDASTNGSTQLVAIGDGTGIQICGYSLFAAGTVNVKLIYGTGVACAGTPTTGTGTLTPAYQFTTQTGLVDPSPAFRGMFVPPGNALCINTSAGVAVQAVVYYARP